MRIERMFVKEQGISQALLEFFVAEPYKNVHVLSQNGNTHT